MASTEIAHSSPFCILIFDFSSSLLIPFLDYSARRDMIPVHVHSIRALRCPGHIEST